MNERILWPPPGRYILAVSGGADSMVLLDLMARAAPARAYELVVAHFDHGIRPDSAQDRLLVAQAARAHGLLCVCETAHLGSTASEAAARAARHGFLERAARGHQATAVITAHHQDDLIETSLLNLARGSGRRGLAPMPGGAVLRPLLGISRDELRAYATTHHITWREDSTNANLANPRNFLRHRLLPAAAPDWGSRYAALVGRLSKLNKKVDQTLSRLLEPLRLDASTYSLPRELVRDLSLPELEELLMMAARQLQPNVELDRRVVQEIALFAKTSAPHRQRPLRQGLNVVAQTGAVRIYYMSISKVGKI